ncbi:MAG: glycosyltransferase family 1 protein [candidate division WOR-3 bacterium]
MRIFLDARLYKRLGGCSRYIEGVYSEIVKISNIEVFAAGDLKILKNSIFKNHISYNSPIYSVFEQIEGSFITKKFENFFDVFHFPFYNVPFILPENSIVTVHDLTQFKFPQFFGNFKVKLAKIVLKRALEKSKIIITNSEFTTKDILKNYKYLENKIRTIYLGVSSEFKPLPKEEITSFKIEKNLGNYILYVGNRKPHKNLGRLIEAFLEIKKSFKDIKLVILGEKYVREGKDIVSKLKRKFNLNDEIIEITKVSTEELVKYYNASLVVVHPSLHEGFGFTPLEAMACGVPAVVSNVSSLPEICGDSAFYFDPYDVKSISESIYKVLKDNNLRQYLINKGFERVKFFSWEKTAQQHLKAFEEVIN